MPCPPETVGSVVGRVVTDGELPFRFLHATMDINSRAHRGLQSPGLSQNPVELGGFGSARPRSQFLHGTSLVSPRRVIFPSLHGARASSPTRPEPQPTSGNGRNDVEDTSPTEVDANIQNSRFNTQVLLRANSLDGILIPLPKLSLKDGGKSNEGWAPTPLLNKRPDVQDPGKRTYSATAPLGNKWNARSSTPAPVHYPKPGLSQLGSSAHDMASKSSIFGNALQRRTYYPAASTPTPVDDRKLPSHDKPRASILRRKIPTALQNKKMNESGNSSASSHAGAGSIFASPHQSQVSGCSGLSPSVPTLASPSSIKSLHANDHGGDSDCIGESLVDLDRISDFPKILPRKECKIHKVQSDTVVAKVEEEQIKPRRDSSASGSHENSMSGVSRHESLECLGSNKRIAFDPHITVYEFGCTDYERKGGEKWWKEDELDRFKQEAIARIRMRSMKVIPTGTGRALAVPTRGEKGPQLGVRPGPILFNHPALGCDDELDPEREITITKHLSREIRNVLVVDPHQIFLALFSKALKAMIPHAAGEFS